MSITLVLLVGLAQAAPPPATLLRRGTVFDGTGEPGRVADVRLEGGRISRIGSLTPRPGETVVDATGLIVAPGFIDLHTHSDRSILAPATRSNRNYQAQGVTTIVTGNCGSGPVDVGGYLDQIDLQGAGTNVAHLIPQGSLRAEIMGNDDRPPTSVELDRMRDLVALGMESGAWGMSTGLIYIPGRYSSTDELIALSKATAPLHGLYASHIRNEGTELLSSLAEATRIGAEAGVRVHVSHLKASGRAAWGLADDACAAIAAARASGQQVTADQYPYIASSTSLGAMVVPDWSLREGKDAFSKLADDPARGAELRQSIAANLEKRDGGRSIRISRFSDRPEWVGKDVVAIAELEKTEPVEIVVRIEKAGGAGAISFGMDEPDVRLIMQQPFVATASDGSAHSPGGEDRPHPRSYGTFPRKIRYALDEKVLSLEQAIRSCTSLPASVLGLPDRGVLRAGAVADVVAFDPATFRDVATFDDPTRYATGVRHLFVNGQAVISNGEFQDVLPGRALRPNTDGPASLVVVPGRVWTGDPSRPWAESVAIRNGQVVAVGPRAEVDVWRGQGTEVLELPGTLATPGLVDAHGHMTMLGQSLEDVDLRDVASLSEVHRLVSERAKTLPDNAWVIGSNWDQSLWPGGEFPDSSTLDSASPDRPVWLRRVDGHAGWANAAAMKAAGITADTQPPSDGQIIRDAQGRPTGVFIDGAMTLVDRVVPGPRRVDIERRILRAQAAVFERGIVGVHDAGVSPAEAEVYRKLAQDGRLKARIYAMASPPGGREVEFVSKPPENFGLNARFRMRSIKLFMDGAMGSRGALMEEPYADDPHNRGLYLIEPDRLRETTEAALRNGWQVCTHAIGDRANTLVVDAYLAAMSAVPEAADPRLRVEHAQVVRPADLPKFASGRIIASMQPAHAGTDQRWADARLGPDRVLGAYAWRWFADARVPLAFGSDFPVEVVDPLWGLFSAVARQNPRHEPPGGWHPEHLLTLHEALEGFTIGSSFASFSESSTGLLRPGYRADLTIFSSDLFTSPPSTWLSTPVSATIVDGEIVHQVR